MRKQVVIPKIALQITGLFFVHGIDLWHIQSQAIKMLAESEESLVFFDIIAKGANKALVVSDFPIWNQSVVPCPVLTLAS